MQEESKEIIRSEPGQAAEAAQTHKLGGLYRNVKMSVRTANVLVLVLLAALVLVTLFLISHNGFTVKFETNGGTAVENCRVLHGETIPDIAPPTREGYVFTGWYLDADCTQPWNPETDVVTDSFTLYAGWEEASLTATS